MKSEPEKDSFSEMQRMKSMDCMQFREVLHELDRPGAEGDALCERALAHAESCSDCAAQLTEMESLSFSLRQLAEESAEVQAPARLETLLLQEFRREKSATASRGVRWQLAAFGIAAAVLLALGLSLHRQHLVTPAGVNSGQGATQTAAQVPGSSAATETSVASLDSNTPAGANSAQVAVADDTEYATAYMPLPYAYDPSELEGAAVVRVVLPRAALVSYGLPVEGMGVRDQVTADMVISQDGTPQAIRLVAQSNANSDTDSDF
jgi:predicted anti-sigma-YlaC factor YlaD